MITYFLRCLTPLKAFKHWGFSLLVPSEGLEPPHPKIADFEL